MSRLTRNLLLAAAVAAGTLFASLPASAMGSPCIRQASVQYREAVRCFEADVELSRFPGHGNRFDVRRLSFAADRFQNAVGHHSDYFRYARSWQELSDLHWRVERSLVAGCRHSDPHLFRSWTRVARAYDRLSDAVEFQARGGRGRSSVWDHRGGNDRLGPMFQPMPPVMPIQPLRPVAPIRGFGASVDPRHEAAAVITATLLQRLIN